MPADNIAIACFAQNAAHLSEHAMNTASRMESTGLAGGVHCTDNFKRELEKEHAAHFHFIGGGL